MAAAQRAAFRELSPFKRLIRLAKSEPVEFAAALVGLPGAIYVVAKALTLVFPFVLPALSMSAWAQGSAGGAPAAASAFQTSRDAFDWYVAGLMGLVLLISIGATFWSKMESKIQFGKDMTKMIVGFIIGFLGAGGR
jgi:hypothetical protein